MSRTHLRFRAPWDRDAEGDNARGRLSLAVTGGAAPDARLSSPPFPPERRSHAKSSGCERPDRGYDGPVKQVPAGKGKDGARSSLERAARAPAEPAATTDAGLVGGLEPLEAAAPVPAFGPHRALAFQRVVGNRAVDRLLAIHRQDGGAPADAGVPAGVETTPRQQIDAALADGNPASIAPIMDFSSATDAERVQLLRNLLGQIAVVAGGPLPADQAGAARRIWQSFGANLQAMAIEHSDLWDQCNAAGANLPDSWLGAAAGSREVNVDEQVGGTVYTVTGAYNYRIKKDAIDITVNMDFQPDEGVTVPEATWFGYIRSTWNTFKAVNQRDPSQQKNIEFKPVRAAGHTIQVSAGTGRANAAHYYVGDTRAPQTIPHEFGHLIGLEDEYERDAPDFERLTGAPVAPAGTGDAETAKTIARGIHDGLMLSERVFEWHSTAIARRQAAVQKVLDDNHIVADYQRGQSALTHEVSRQYVALFGHEMSVDFMDRISARWPWEDSDAYQDWRERVLGTFQYTNTSIMGDMSDHSHPVEPRHVRTFAEIIGTAVPGDWQPQAR